MKPFIKIVSFTSAIILFSLIFMQPMKIVASSTGSSVLESETVIDESLKVETSGELSPENKDLFNDLSGLTSTNSIQSFRSATSQNVTVTEADNSQIAFTYNGNEYKYVVDGNDLLLQVGTEYVYALQNEIVETLAPDTQGISTFASTKGINRPSWKFIGTYETTNKKFLDGIAALGLVIGLAAEIFGFGGFLFGKVTLGADFLLFLYTQNTQDYWGTVYQFKDVLCSTYIREETVWFDTPPNASNRKVVKESGHMFHTVNPDNTNNGYCYGLV